MIASTLAIVGLTGWLFRPELSKWIQSTPPVEAKIAEPSYFDTVMAVDSNSEKPFLTDSRLIDTHTPYPIPRGSPLSMQALLDRGEICGVRLGMSMSDVVRVWGKPTSLVGLCGIGPLMWYTKPDGWVDDDGITLHFQSNRLEVIVVWGSACEELAFDNGTTGKMAAKDITILLGKPLESPPKVRINGGTAVYIHRDIRLDLNFQPSDDDSREEMEALTVRFKEGPTIINALGPH